MIYYFTIQALPSALLPSHPSPSSAEPCPPQPPPLPEGAIAGIVVAGVAIVVTVTAAVIFGILMIRRFTKWSRVPSSSGKVFYPQYAHSCTHTHLHAWMRISKWKHLHTHTLRPILIIIMQMHMHSQKLYDIAGVYTHVHINSHIHLASMPISFVVTSLLFLIEGNTLLHHCCVPITRQATR